MKINIKDTFNKELKADTDLTNSRRQVVNACYSFVTPRIPSNPKLIHFSDDFAKEIGLENDVNSEKFLKIFSGSEVYPDTNPFAMCYGGHQFGNWAGQLGDGRAINLFELEHNNKHWALQLKGAGETPYSRTADGLAVLRSSIREHLCSEAMFYLGVPTTRSLSLITTGDSVLRDVMYNGNPAYEKGAVVCRVAPSFIRFGNFQLLAARNDLQLLKELCDYTIKHLFPNNNSEGNEKYLLFYQEVANKTLKMIVEWQRVGFVHGVMNTDNMSILGLTIDFGPYGWLEDFDPNWTPNTTDAQGKRYRFGNQPDIALWNLVQLGNALYPLIEDLPAMQTILDQFGKEYAIRYDKMMHQKLGLENQHDEQILADLHTNLNASETDMTLFFRNLGNIEKTDNAENALKKIENAFYKPEQITASISENWLKWLSTYIEKINSENTTDNERKSAMNAVNPKYVFRNYMAQLAIEAAEKEDYSLIQELYLLLKNPYSEQPENEKWFAKRPEWARNKVGCSMLSCSS
jgi:uncharacterized protein YdiU (UPF0061 family)